MRSLDMEGLFNFSIRSDEKVQEDQNREEKSEARNR